MKKLNFVMPLIFAVVLFFGCSNDDEKDIRKTIEMTIYSETGFSGFVLSENLYVEFLLFSEGNSNNQNVLISGGISFDDFEYEKGYEYKIKAIKTTLANPPQDGSSIVYDYLETISKKKVVTENSEQQIEIEVAPQKVEYITMSETGRQEAFFIKENGAINSKPLLTIENFDYEAGNRYKLKVKKIIQAEPYAVRYVLIEVLLKQKV